jgi:hypothetical protein
LPELSGISGVLMADQVIDTHSAELADLGQNRPLIST